MLRNVVAYLCGHIKKKTLVWPHAESPSSMRICFYFLTTLRFGLESTPVIKCARGQPVRRQLPGPDFSAPLLSRVYLI